MLQLAKIYNNTNVESWYLSEKLDGMRCWWDGGVTRGKPASEVPWADTAKDKRQVYSTGLWSRRGKVIHAPDYWIEELPPISLDGELWLGRKNFQDLISIVRRSVNIRETDWMNVQFRVFDSPAIGVIPGFDAKLFRGGLLYNLGDNYREVLGSLQDTLESRVAFVIDQKVLGSDYVNEMKEYFESVVSVGGEGLMLRHPSLLWKPGRRHSLLKVKGTLDAEGVVVGYRAGRGKHEGRMGALTVRWKGKLFDISGFTDAEREMEIVSDPGEDQLIPENENFPLNSKVTFTFRELTDRGIPKEARYLRHG